MERLATLDLEIVPEYEGLRFVPDMDDISIDGEVKGGFPLT